MMDGLDAANYLDRRAKELRDWMTANSKEDEISLAVAIAFEGAAFELREQARGIPVRLVFYWRTLTVTRVYSAEYRTWGLKNFRGRRSLDLGPIQFGWGVMQ